MKLKNSTYNKSQMLQIKVCEVSIKYVNIAMMISRWLLTQVLTGTHGESKPAREKWKP